MVPMSMSSMGTLVDEPSIRPTEHIFVGSKAPWFTITDDLPQHQTADPPSAQPAGRDMQADLGAAVRSG